MTGSPVSKVLDAVQSSTGHTHKRCGQGWTARCPAHNDRKPSLSISTGDDSRVLLHCHAGCPTEVIVGAIGLKMRDLMTPGVNVYETPRRKVVRGSFVDVDNVDTGNHGQTYASQQQAIGVLERRLGPCSMQWTYHDANGQPVGVVVRWDGSNGKDIRPVSHNKVGWTIGGMPSPRPLYRLPDLLAAPKGTRIYVCEGEKAAEAARAVGLIATTSPHGSKSAAKADWSPLAGREVVILPDADKAGEQYADDVLAILSKLNSAPGDGPRIAPVIKVVDLPDLPGHGDVHDWITTQREGGMSDESICAELQHLADEADPVELAIPMLHPQQFAPFPVDTLPKPVASFVADGARAMGCDPSYLALPLLSALASAIGNTRCIELKSSWSEPAIVWAAIVGESGTMKSPALELVLRPVRQRQDKAMREYGEAVKRYQEEILQYERDLAVWRKSTAPDDPPVKPEEPVPSRCWCDDTTVEALAVLLLNQPRGLLMVRDELAGWLKGFDRYAQGKGGDVAKWLEMFGGRPMMVDRKSGNPRTLYVSRAAVSIAGGIQPETLRRALGAEHRENGLAARLLLAWPPRRAKRWTEDEIPDPLAQAVAAVFERLYGLKPHVNEEKEPCPVVVPLTPAGKAAWVRFYNEHATQQTGLTGDLSAAWSKLEGYAARLALVIHFVRWAADDPTLADPDHIDEQSIQGGVRLSRWFGHEARRVYAMLNESDDDRDRRRLIELIQAKGGSISGSELVRASRAYETVIKAEAALEKLVQVGLGRWEQPPQTGKGRPRAQRFVLNRQPVNVYENTTDDNAKANIVDVDNVGGTDADEWGEI